MGGKSRSSSSQNTTNHNTSYGLYGENGVAGEGNTVDHSRTEQGDLANNTGTINITDGEAFKTVDNALEEIGGFASDTVDKSLDMVGDAFEQSNKTVSKAIESANKSTEQVVDFAGETVGDVLGFASSNTRETIDGFREQNEDLLKAVGSQNTLLAETLGEGFAAANRANAELMQQTTQSNADLATATANAGQTIVADSAVDMLKVIGGVLAVAAIAWAVKG